MRKTIHRTFSLLALLLLVSTLGNTRIPVAGSLKCARTEDLEMKFYSNIEDAYQALKSGSIDILGYEVTADLYDDSINDANIALAPVADLGMYEFDINSNCTMPSYPGLRSPTNYRGFRQAIAYLVDKAYIVEQICGGFAERLDQPLSAGFTGWRNESMWYPNYPYEYNPQAAADAFDVAGFLQGTTNNSYYDPAFPGSAETIRTYPVDHSKAGEDLDHLIVIGRHDDWRRWQAANLLTDNLRKHGIPARLYAYPSMIPWPDPWALDYHILTGGWSLTLYPPSYLYGLYHSSNWGIDASNYVTGLNCSGLPNYPRLDELLSNARYAPTQDEAVTYTKQALGYFTEECIAIPLFSAKSYWPYNADLLGVVNNPVFGLNNELSFLNMYKADGSPIRFGLKTPPVALNQIYSSWYFDYQCLDRMTLYNGVDRPPYDMSVIQPGYLKSWTVGSWVDPDTSETKAMITQTYRSDAYFVEPVTGNQLENVNMTHHYASLWYQYQLSDARKHYEISFIKTLRITDPYTIKIYYNYPEYWRTVHMGSSGIFSFNWFTKTPLSTTVTANHTADATTGYLSCGADVFWVVETKVNETVLTQGVDYDIYEALEGHSSQADVRIINPTYLGETVEITYYAVGDPLGYFVSGLPWQDALEGAGMYYAIDFTPEAGGSLVLKRNPYYWMETPPLGEVDFVRKPNGCLGVDIYDVVMAANSYGSQGENIPDPHWLPGADLAPPGGAVDIFDIVTVASKYGQEFDCDP